MTDWNRGFQAGWEAAGSHKSETAMALATLKDDHRTFVNNASAALIQNDERIHQLEKRLKEVYQECADICERRANSLRDGAAVARQCGKDILSRATSA